MGRYSCLWLVLMMLGFNACISPDHIGGVYTCSTGDLSLGSDYYSLSASSHRYGPVYSKGSWTRTGDTIRLNGIFNSSNLHHLEVDRKMEGFGKWFTDTILFNRVLVEQHETNDPTIVIDALVNDSIRIRLPRAGIINGHDDVMLSDSPQIARARWETIQFKIYHLKPDREHPVDTLYSYKLALDRNPHGFVVGDLVLDFSSYDFDRCELKDSPIIIVTDGKLKWRDEVFRWRLLNNLM